MSVVSLGASEVRPATGEEKVCEMTENIDEQVDTVSDQVATFIVKDLQWDGKREELLSLDDPVELPAVLDSTDLLELAGYLEDAFAIRIDDEEIVADNFANVRRLAELIVDKKTGTTAA
jgi:acyl carrier protein